MPDHDVEYTAQQKREYQAKFARKQRIENVAGLFVVLPLLCITLGVVLDVAGEQLLGLSLNESTFFLFCMPPAFVLAMCGFLISVVNWRCPACGAGLPRTLIGRKAKMRSRYCSKCGIELQ